MLATTRITLEVNGIDLHFEPNSTAYNKLINEMSPTNKVAPIVNYLQRIVSSDSKDALAAVLENPAASFQICEKINEQFAPALDIVAKK